jgi:hypothetical protein
MDESNFYWLFALRRMGRKPNVDTTALPVPRHADPATLAGNQHNRFDLIGRTVLASKSDIPQGAIRRDRSQRPYWHGLSRPRRRAIKLYRVETLALRARRIAYTDKDAQ